MERFIQRLLDLHHVYHWCRLISLREVDLVEIVDIAVLGVVGKKMVQGIPSGRGVVGVERYALSRVAVITKSSSCHLERCARAGCSALVAW